MSILFRMLDGGGTLEENKLANGTGMKGAREGLECKQGGQEVIP